MYSCLEQVINTQSITKQYNNDILPLVLAYILIGINLVQLTLSISGIVIGSVCFAFFEQLMSAPPVDQTSTIMMISTMVKFPLVFNSGIFIPLASLPDLIRFIALLSPLTYLADLFWISLTEFSVFHPILNLSAIAGWAVFLAIASLILHRRTLEKRL